MVTLEIFLSLALNKTIIAMNCSAKIYANSILADACLAPAKSKYFLLSLC